jgi:hypothetical protein
MPRLVRQVGRVRLREVWRWTMTPRASIDRAESAALAAGGTFHQRGTNIFRSIGICHGGTRSESLVFLYDPERGRINVHCHAGCDFDAVLDTLRMTRADRYDEPRRRDAEPVWPPRLPRPRPPVPEPVQFDPAPLGWTPPRDPWMPCGHRKTDEYPYTDESDRLLYAVARCELKGDGCEGFRQWRPVPRAPHRRWSLTDKDAHGNVIACVRAVPFRLPALLAGIAAGRPIYITEGEKDTLALEAAGQVATCNHEGAGKWTAQHHAVHLQDADVIVIADQDWAGRRHVEHVVDTLTTLARSITVAVAKTGKDAFDHLAAGYPVSEFVTIWEPLAPEEVS